MKTNSKVTTQAKKKKNGFTLIEVIAVLVLLGILAAVAVPKYINMADEARSTAITAGVAELNSREALTWSKESLSSGGWGSDIIADTDLGGEYDSSGITLGSGNLVFQTTKTVALTRAAATAASPGAWSE